MSDDNGTNGRSEHTCTHHEGVTITFRGEQCPLCVSQRGNEAIAKAATACGMVILKLASSGLPFALAMPREYGHIGQATMDAINGILKEMNDAITAGRPPIAVARPTLVVPR